MVPRMSVRSIEKLRDEVLELIGRARCNKLTAMKLPWRNTAEDEKDLNHIELNDLLYSNEEMSGIASEG